MFACANRNAVCDGTCLGCPKLRGKRKFVFLDIDGVLNSRSYLESAGPAPEAIPGSPTDLELGSWQISESLVAVLNGLVQDDVVFVLSSMWRRLYRLEDVQAMLESRGFKGKLASKTPALQTHRGAEIEAWIESELGIEISAGQRGWPSFVILDDDDDMGRLRGRLIRTRYDDGLTDYHVTVARNMLGLV